jgi:PilZ domain
MKEHQKNNSRPRERRRSVRHFFGGAAEVTETESGKYLVGMVRQISPHGCFILTTKPFPPDTNVNLQITHKRTLLVLRGKVVSTKKTGGMAVTFEAMLPETKAVLEDWLNKVDDQEASRNC